MRFWATAVIALASCGPDETVTGYLQSDGVFYLQSIDGRAIDATATLDLSETGQISGQAPCNRYSASQNAPYPWFDVGPILATKRACPALREEAAYFDALSTMKFAETSGTVLILSNEDGAEMVFQTDP